MYTPHTARDIEEMLRVVGVASLDELVRVPDAVAIKAPLELVPALSEIEIAERFAAFAERTAASGYLSFLGAGAYRHYVPPVIGALAMRGEFLTSYTPYQAEVSQGYLQAIYEWQTYIALLTGMDVANASVYDGATALAEAAIMAINATGRKAVLVSQRRSPELSGGLAHLRGRARRRRRRAAVRRGRNDRPDDARDGARRSAVCRGRHAVAELLRRDRCAAAAAVAAIKATQTLLIGVVAEALSLAALATPASWGVDIAVGEAQSFGNRRRLRRTARRLHRDDQRATAPHSRAARRAHRRQRRTDRVRADAASARAAHPARESDVEHLHEPSALRADRDDLSGRAGQDRLARRRRAQPRADGGAARGRDAHRRVCEPVRRTDVQRVRAARAGPRVG